MTTAEEEMKQQAESEYEHACAHDPKIGAGIRAVMDRVGDKWSMLVIMVLEAGPLRYGELKRKVVGVSQRMLTLTLRHLERDGLVSRTIYPQIPPRVDYELTALGRTLIPPAQGIAYWAITNYPQIEQARHRYDQDNPDTEDLAD